MKSDTCVFHLPPPLEIEIDRAFTALYRDLSRAFPHPLDWVGLMRRPRWWHVTARVAHVRVVDIFARHGFVLTPVLAERFLTRTSPQQLTEDAGGAFVRRLREAFQWQMGVPYPPLTCIDGGRNA